MRRTGLIWSALFVVGVGSADAQTIAQPPGGRIITFGDSLSDNGNLPPGFAPPPPYAGGRFSNGPVWTELISGGSMNSPTRGQPNAGNVNFAFGGARTDNAPNANGPIPSMQQQLGLFGLTGGTFTRADTVTLLGGANNIFQYLAAPGVTPGGIAATSTSSATDIVNMTNGIAAAGAGRILVSNLPSIAASPAFNTDPAAAGAAGAAVSIFNQALASGIAAAAAANPQTNIVQMDLAGAFSVISQNAAFFGLTNVTQACIAVATCVGGSAATQNAFLFWDGVHPTARGHQLIALYANLLLSPEASAADVAVLGDVAVRGRLAATDDVLDRASGWSEGQYQKRNGAWISVTGSRGLMDARGDTAGYNYTTGGMRVGVDQALSPNFLAGVAVGASGGSLGGTVRSDLLAFDADAYATYTAGSFFVTGAAGASWMSFDDLRRNTGLGPVAATGSTTASQLSAALEAGFMTRVGGLTVVPSARLQYVHADVNGYAETAPILAMAFGGRTLEAVIGGVRVRASAPAALFGAQGRAFGEIGYERVLSQDQDGVLARFVGNTAQPFAGRPGDLTGRGLNLKVGYDAKISETVSLTLSYGAALNDGDGITHTGQVRVKMPF
jgi:outer membrane lipase/esterase